MSFGETIQTVTHSGVFPRVRVSWREVPPPKDGYSYPIEHGISLAFGEFFICYTLHFAEFYDVRVQTVVSLLEWPPFAGKKRVIEIMDEASG